MSLDKEQIVQVILDAYTARKETKDYFEFFLNPDVDKLSEKFRLKISKELNRTKRRSSRARISVINGAIKEFSSYDPGAEHVVDLTVYAIKYALLAEEAVYFTETLFKGFAKITTGLLEYGDNNLVADKVIAELNAIVNGEVGTRYFRNLLRTAIESFNPSSQLRLP